MAKVRFKGAFLGGLMTVAVAAFLPYPRRKDMGQQPQQPKQPFDPNVLPNNPALPRDPSQRAFILKIAPLARKVQVLTGIPASVGIAQAIHETGWGTSGMYRDLKNLYGFKTGGRCDGSDRSDGTKPLEVPWTSQYRPVNEPCPYFRKYASEYDSILDWALRFYRCALYSCPYKGKPDLVVLHALSYRQNWLAFLNAGALHSYNPLPGDPESRQYTEKIINLIRSYQLYRYDVPVQYWKLREDVSKVVPVA